MTHTPDPDQKPRQPDPRLERPDWGVAEERDGSKQIQHKAPPHDEDR